MQNEDTTKLVHHIIAVLVLAQAIIIFAFGSWMLLELSREMSPMSIQYAGEFWLILPFMAVGFVPLWLGVTQLGHRGRIDFVERWAQASSILTLVFIILLIPNLWMMDLFRLLLLIVPGILCLTSFVTLRLLKKITKTELQ